MTERWCNIVLVVAGLYITANVLLVHGMSVETISVIGVLMIEASVLWYSVQKNELNITNQSVFRPNVSSGMFNMLLVPLTFMGQLCSRKQFEDSVNLFTELWLSIAVVAVLTLRVALIENLYHQMIVLIGFPSFGAVLAMVYGWVSVFSLLTWYFTWKCLELVPNCFPKSFTFGELALVLQVFASWITRMGLSLFQVHTLSEEDTQLVWFICTLVAAIMIATMIVYLTTAYSSLWQFLAVYIILALVSLIVLYTFFIENPVLWLLSFVFGSCTKVMLFVTWVILLAVAIVWTVAQGLQNTSSSQTLEHEDQLSLPKLLSVRKVFHVFIVLVYFPGLILDVRLLLLASTAAFGLFIILEAARALKVPVIGEPLDKILRTFIDDRDQGLIFLTHIYLLVGLSLPLWMSHRLFYSQSAPIELYSGGLSLGVGDTVACLAGKAWGRVHWPGSKKTIEGTLFSIVLQLLLIFIISYIGIFAVLNWLNVFAGVCLSALVEAFTDQIDNLLLPLVLYPFLFIS